MLDHDAQLMNKCRQKGLGETNGTYMTAPSQMGLAVKAPRHALFCRKCKRGYRAMW